MIHSGEHETLKAGYHAALGVLIAGAGVYNVRAYVVRREPHLARNALLYLGLTIWELVKVIHHVEKR